MEKKQEKEIKKIIKLHNGIFEKRSYIDGEYFMTTDDFLRKAYEMGFAAGQLELIKKVKGE